MPLYYIFLLEWLMGRSGGGGGGGGGGGWNEEIAQVKNGAQLVPPNFSHQVSF